MRRRQIVRVLTGLRYAVTQTTNPAPGCQWSPSTTATRNITTFVMISTAHSYGIKVAAHARAIESIRILLFLGADSVEHSIATPIVNFEPNK
uniref:Uncharacterized protein n=1 Tax=Moniliophthora roreri TaxID=221103 RepID=A0A0W0G6B5_MONRR